MLAAMTAVNFTQFKILLLGSAVKFSSITFFEIQPMPAARPVKVDASSAGFSDVWTYRHWVAVTGPILLKRHWRQRSRISCPCSLCIEEHKSCQSRRWSFQRANQVLVWSSYLVLLLKLLRIIPFSESSLPLGELILTLQWLRNSGFYRSRRFLGDTKLLHSLDWTRLRSDEARVVGRPRSLVVWSIGELTIVPV